MPPATPPTMPPSTPPTTPFTPLSIPVSALISFGASTGAAVGLTSIGGGGAAACCGGGGGGGGRGGGRGAAAAHAIIIPGGVGSTSAAIKGMMMTAAINTVCATTDSGTVYQLRLPTLMDGLTTSPNMSRATGESPCWSAASLSDNPLCCRGPELKGADYSQTKNDESTRLTPLEFLRHRSVPNGSPTPSYDPDLMLIPQKERRTNTSERNMMMVAGP